jgi:hypothetical protein
MKLINCSNKLIMNPSAFHSISEVSGNKSSQAQHCYTVRALKAGLGRQEIPKSEKCFSDLVKYVEALLLMHDALCWY